MGKLELQLTLAKRDHESSTQALSTLQKQYDHLASQQTHWDSLHHAAQQIDNISSMLSHADDEQMRELKRIRDRNHILEGEHTALQKRFRDQESKIANTERALVTARQSLATANQRSAEWERRAKESEGKYELVQTQLDQLEQTHNQLEADHSLVKLQLEEKEAEERLSKVTQSIFGILARPVTLLFRTRRADCESKFLRSKVASYVYKPKSSVCVSGKRRALHRHTTRPQPTACHHNHILAPPIEVLRKRQGQVAPGAIPHRLTAGCGTRCTLPDLRYPNIRCLDPFRPSQGTPLRLGIAHLIHPVPPSVS